MRTAALFTALLVAACGAWAMEESAALLPDDAPNGWQRAGQPRVFTGSGLYGHIDGGAEIFFELGFEEVTVQRYVSGSDAVEVELYRMSDAGAALGIYLQRCANRCEAPGAYPGLPRYTTLGRSQAMLAQGRFLAIVTADRVTDAASAAMREVASRLARRLPPGSTLEPGAVLPPGWAPGSLRLIRGPLGLQAIVTFGEGDVLRLGGHLTAAAADYAAAPGTPAHTLIVVEYPDAAGASAALAHLRSGLDSEIRVLRESGSSFVFRDYAGRVGEARSDDRRLTIRLNLASEPGSARE